MTNCNIVFTITCQGEWAVQMVLSEWYRWPDWLCRVQRWDCVIIWKWKQVEMFTLDLHYVSQISGLDVFEQAVMTVLTNYCSAATGVEGSCPDLQILKNCLTLCVLSFSEVDSKKTCARLVWRLHTHFSTHREAHHSCKGQNQKPGVMDTGRWWCQESINLQLWTWTENEASCAGECIQFLMFIFNTAWLKAVLFPL